eukprot:TRINITY_DN15617_c0_g1_i1.p2 TRINITY_DN15617_c0_g1~~TRINITY_DN15617_c0_g1_i1.p2  ORF type:complete len:401 (+),score=44.00 TRINITY_DN15617_c0_g1_i1:1549-2751(+)
MLEHPQESNSYTSYYEPGMNVVAPPDVVGILPPAVPYATPLSPKRPPVAPISFSIPQEYIMSIQSPPPSATTRDANLPPRLGLEISTLRANHSLPQTPFPVHADTLSQAPTQLASVDEVLYEIEEVERKKFAALQQKEQLAQMETHAQTLAEMQDPREAELASLSFENMQEDPNHPQPLAPLKRSTSIVIVKPDARTSLGLEFASESPLILKSVSKGSPAAMSGVEVFNGRCLQAINNNPVFTVHELRRYAEGNPRICLTFSDEVFLSAHIYQPLEPSQTRGRTQSWDQGLPRQQDVDVLSPEISAKLIHQEISGRQRAKDGEAMAWVALMGKIVSEARTLSVYKRESREHALFPRERLPDVVPRNPLNSARDLSPTRPQQPSWVRIQDNNIENVMWMQQ